MQSRTYTIFAIILFISGCTNLKSLQDLQVDLVNIEPAAMQSMSPKFNLQLLITNPNAEDLEIEGMNFQLDIADKQILSGVSNEIPILKGYSETTVNVSASIHLLDLLKLITVMGTEKDKPIEYELNTYIDPKGFLGFNLQKQGLLDEFLLENLQLK